MQNFRLSKSRTLRAGSHLARKIAMALTGLTALIGLSASPARAEPSTDPSSVEEIRKRAQQTMASGVSIFLKEGAKSSVAEIAARNKVAFDRIEPGMFGAIKLVREELVPLSVSSADAQRLRADPDVESASASYVIQTKLVVPR